MDADTLLRNLLFKRCKALLFAGAGLSQPVWDKLGPDPCRRHRHCPGGLTLKD